MMSVLFRVIAVALVLSSSVQAAYVEVQGHRGARAVLPENTLASLKYALELGVDVLEFDLGVTKDNILVLHHDHHINPKICLRKGKPFKENLLIKDLTLKEIKQFDCGSVKNPRFPKQKSVPGERIPTLDEVFEMVKASKAKTKDKLRFNIETKLKPAPAEEFPEPKKFAKLFVETVKRHKVLDRVILQSFDYRTLVEAKKIEPKLQTAFLHYGSLPDYAALAKSMRVNAISPNQYWFTKEDVSRLKAINVELVPWTANNEEEWERLISRGVTSIITDDPAALIAFLKKKKLR